MSTNLHCLGYFYLLIYNVWDICCEILFKNLKNVYTYILIYIDVDIDISQFYYLHICVVKFDLNPQKSYTRIC